MSEDEKINTSTTDRMTLISQSVCEKMMNACSQRENEKFEFLSEEVDAMKTDIKTGFEEIRLTIEKSKTEKAGRAWDIIQIIVTAALAAVVAYKWH